MTATITLGPEHDEDLQRTLIAVLEEMGAELEPAGWGVAGSQEIVARDARLGGDTMRIEAETYIGLSLTGPEHLVRDVEARVKARRARSNDTINVDHRNLR
jgi:hypothetical protein